MTNQQPAVTRQTLLASKAESIRKIKDHRQQLDYLLSHESSFTPEKFKSEKWFLEAFLFSFECNLQAAEDALASGHYP